MTNTQLFLVCVAVWGSTWFAITLQLGVVAPEASVAYRFLFASLLVFAFSALRKMRLRYSLAEHGWMALFGVLMFSVQYISVYYAERYVVSGLVAVGYSAIPLLAMLGLRLFFGTPMTFRVALGGVLGIAGIALVFLPEFMLWQHKGNPLVGAIFTVVGVLTATAANMVTHRNQEAGLPLWQTMAYGMLYGGLFSLAVTLGTGQPLNFEMSLSYVLSLFYLAVFGSVVGFAAYLTLVARIGAARAGYIGVMVPVVALVISGIFEGFRWQVLTWVGVLVLVAGNVVMLRGKRKEEARSQQPVGRHAN